MKPVCVHLSFFRYLSFSSDQNPLNFPIHGELAFQNDIKGLFCGNQLNSLCKPIGSAITI